MPESVSVPAPSWVTAPVPPIAGAKLTLSERLKIRSALSTTLLVVERSPLVPPLPIWSAPAPIVVTPV